MIMSFNTYERQLAIMAIFAAYIASAKEVVGMTAAISTFARSLIILGINEDEGRRTTWQSLF